ncbi:MAG TPA: hypothetical protein VJO32_10920 [Ktedonobacteraceae bacterium]|nr:hypothetical protein [Ktedonobacteraceae bacterium]
MLHQKVDGDMINDKQLTPLFTLYGKPCELIAIETAVTTYIRLLKITVPPSSERTEVIMMLQLFRKRCEGPLKQWETKSSKIKEDALLPVQTTKSELLAFGSAVIGYIALSNAIVEPYPICSEVIGHLVRFQKRYLENSQPFIAPLKD